MEQLPIMVDDVTIKGEQTDEIRKLALQDPPMTIDAISETIGVPRSSTARIVKKVREEAKERATLQSQLFKREHTADALMTLLERVPGIAEGRIEFARMAASSNPLLLSQPMELYQFCTQALSMQPYTADMIVKSFFADFFAQQPTPSSPGYVYPNPGQPSSPINYPLYATQTNPSVAPQYPYQAPPANANQGPMREDDVRRIIDESREAQVEEVEEPARNKDGSVALDGRGNPIMITRRKPIGSGGGMDQLMQMAQLMTLLGVGPGQKQNGPDPATTAMLEAMRTQTAMVQAQLAAMNARSEEAAKWQGVVASKDQAVTDLLIKTAAARAGLPPEQQIQLKSIDALANVVNKGVDNMDKRMDRLEKVAAPVLGRFAAGIQNDMNPGTLPDVPMPPSDALLGPLAAANGTPKQVGPVPDPELPPA